MEYDVAVVGGGVLGCFAARSLTRYRLRVVLLEEREDLCTGISRANTAIVYSGCDTAPGSLKSRMCVRAAQSFSALCGELGVRYVQCGSVMVCFGPRGERVIKRKYEQGLENGVRGLELLDGKKARELEPNLRGDVRLALYAPEAGTVMPWELGLAAAENAVSNGAEVRLNAKVTAIRKKGPWYEISAGGGLVRARGVVNCAGLFADEVMEMVLEPSVRVFPSAGEYFVLDTKAAGFVRRVVFHEPEEKGKGVTFVPTAEGNILVGPSEVPSEEKTGFRTTREGLRRLMEEAVRAMPGLPVEHVIRSFGAIRPNPRLVRLDPESGKYVPEDRSIGDFTIVESGDDMPFVSLVGIKTPGLTCAGELGEYVAAIVAGRLGAEANPNFNPTRRLPLRLAELPFEERARLVRENPAYGRIVCRCRGVSEGEIVDCIRRPIGAVTVDGVKRRTLAGSGRCQGGFCTQRIVEILSRELGVAPEEINKDGPGSRVIGGGRRGT